MSKFTSTLPFLLNRAGVLLGDLFSREIAQDGLTLPMYRVLAALTEENGQRLMDLSTVTGVEMTTLSRLSVTMARRGLLVRERPSENLRVVLVTLTPDGQKFAEKLISRATHYEKVAFGNLAAGEITVLKEQLRRIFNRLETFEGLQPNTVSESVQKRR